MDALPPIVDPALSGGGVSMLSAKMGPAGNIDKAAHDFEAMFATQLLQPMFEGVGVDQTFGGGHGEEIMRSFLVQEYGKLIAKSGKLGIASQVKSEMLRAQEAANGRGASRGSATTGAAKNSYVNAASMGGGNVSVQ